MFKVWRGKTRSFASGAWKRFRIFWLPLSAKRRLAYAATTLAVIVVAICIITSLIVLVNNKLNAPKVIATPEQAMQDNLSRLLDNPPKGNATAEARVSYYKQLSVARADDKNYKAAAEAIGDQSKANPAKMTYSDYVQQAIYYHQANDNQAALAALNNATAIMPKQDNPDSGYVFAINQDHINTLREAYKK